MYLQLMCSCEYYFISSFIMDFPAVCCCCLVSTTSLIVNVLAYFFYIFLYSFFCWFGFITNSVSIFRKQTLTGWAIKINHNGLVLDNGRDAFCEMLVNLQMVKDFICFHRELLSNKFQLVYNALLGFLGFYIYCADEEGRKM